VNRILVIRFSSIGDIVLTAPVVPALMTRYPEASIDYLTHAHFAPIVERFDPRPQAVLPFPGIGARELPAYSRQLAQKNYSLVVDLHDSLRSKVLRRYFKGAEVRVYRKPRLKRWLLFNLRINRYAPDFSVAREYLRYAGLAGAGVRPAMQLTGEEGAAARARFGLPTDYLTLVPGAAWPQKSWPADRYVDLIGRITTKSGAPVILLGGPGDAICSRIAAGAGSAAVFNLKGQTDLAAAMAVLAGSRLVVGADTGLVHMAEALGRPVVLILGPTGRETGARTHHPHSVTHECDLWCRPCSQNGRRRCYRREQYCLTGIRPAVVAESVNRLMTRV